MLGYRSILAIVLCPFASAAGALPQSNQNLENPNQEHLFPFGTGTLEHFRRTAAADFNGDGLSDLIVQRGTDLEMLFAPGHFGVHLGTFTQANDMAVLPGANPGDPPSLIIVGPGGLKRLTWNDWAPSFWDVETLATNGWLNAVHVSVSNSPGTGVVYAVAEDKRTVLRYDIDTQGADAPFSVQQNVRDLQVVRVDDIHPPHQLALMTATTLDVYTTEGAFLFPSGPCPESHAFVPVHSEGSSLEQLQWFITGPGEVNEFQVSVDPSAVLNQNNLGSVTDVLACTSGDDDGDEDDDILYSRRDVQSLMIVRNVPANSPYPFKQTLAGGAQLEIPYGTGGPPQTDAQPSWTDIDNDGDLDICFPVELGSQIFVLPNDRIPAGGEAPSIVIHEDNTGGQATTAGGITTVSMEISAPWIQDAHHLEVRVWRRENDDDPTDPLYDPPMTFAPVSQTSEDARFQVEIQLDSEEPVYFLMMRWVSEGGAAEAPHFPARVCGLQLGGWFDYLEGLRVGPMVNLSYGVIGIPGTVCEIVLIPDLAADDPPRPRF